MKLHIAWLTLLCLALAVVPASAQTQTLYSNGPADGNTDAYNIGSYGRWDVVSDTFNIQNCGLCWPSTVTGFDFWVWEAPGGTLASVDWSITSDEFGGKVYGSGTASNPSDTFISTNSYNYSIDLITVTRLNVPLYYGTYWLNLQNARSYGGNDVYWDENRGPSQASDNAIGTIASESFDIIGSPGHSYIPEPSGILLFGSGVVALAGVLRRKLF